MTAPAIDPARPMVAITFDDGYKSVADIALPEMRARGMVATHYITTGHVAFDERYVVSDDIARFVDGGWEIGSHAVTHVNMTTLDPAELEIQLSRSKEMFEALTGAPVTSFSSPLGEVNTQTNAAIGEHYENHVNAFSPARGLNTLVDFDPLNVHRIDYANTSVEEVCQVVKNLPKDSMYVLIMHNISEAETHPRDVWIYDIAPAEFTAILDCVEAADVNVVRVSDGVDSMKERAANVGL